MLNKIKEFWHEMRERSDYNCYYDVSKDDILPMIQPVGELIDIISGILKSL